VSPSAGRWSSGLARLCRFAAMCAAESGAFGGVYRPGPVTGADDLAMMRRIDELHLKWPFTARGAWCSNSTRQATASTASACKG